MSLRTCGGLMKVFDSCSWVAFTFSGHCWGDNSSLTSSAQTRGLNHAPVPAKSPGFPFTPWSNKMLSLHRHLLLRLFYTYGYIPKCLNSSVIDLYAAESVHSQNNPTAVLLCHDPTAVLLLCHIEGLTLEPPFLYK